MPLSSADLISIYERSSSLSERIAGNFTPADTDDTLKARRLARWKQVAAGGDPQRFAAVLNSLGMSRPSEKTILALLGSVRQLPSTAMPRWNLLLAEISQNIFGALGPSEGIGGKMGVMHLAGNRIPFVQIFQAIVALAQNHIRSTHSNVDMWFTTQSWRGLQEHLLRRISGIVAVPLQTAFLAHKSISQSGMAGYFFQSQPRSETSDHCRLYKGFVREQKADGLRAFFMRYPVAARLVAEVTQSWIEFVGEFLGRLEQDREELVAFFQSGMPLGKMVAVKAGISDPHHGGRSVLILTFLSGARLVYKPRSMSIDRVYFSLIEELNARGLDPDLRVLKTVDRGDYGWVEFAPHMACSNPRAAERFYRRAGSLACLIHWLQGIDCHRENFVASGDHPVIVDLETLAHPLRLGELAHADSRSPWLLALSALRTGLLPLWQPRSVGSSLYDNSGLGAPISQRSVVPTIQWKHINTDRMQVTTGTRCQIHSAHRAKLNGRALSIQAFERPLLQGIHQMYTLLETRRENPFHGWRDLIRATLRRHIKRPTLIYAMLMRRTLQPEYLTDGVERSIELQALPLASVDEREWVEEVHSLEKLDVPYFQIGKANRSQNAKLPTPPTVILSVEEDQILRLSVQRRLQLVEGRLWRRGTFLAHQVKPTTKERIRAGRG